MESTRILRGQKTTHVTPTNNSTSKSAASASDLANVSTPKPSPSSAAGLGSPMPANITSMFKQLQAALSKKIDDANLNSSTLINELKQHMEQSYLALTNTINDKISSMQTEVRSVADQFSTLTANVDRKMKEHDCAISTRLDQLERKEKMLDVIVKNIPKVPSEVMSTIFSAICLTIGLQDRPRILTMYRMRISNQRTPPIVIKFLDWNQKLLFMNAYLKNHSLSTDNIGFDTSSRIYVNDALSKRNSIIFAKALALKKRGLLRSVATKSGLVFVKFANSISPSYVSDLETLSLVENGSYTDAPDDDI